MFMPHRLYLTASLLALSGAACGTDINQSASLDLVDSVTATRVTDGVRIANVGDERVGFVVLNPEWLGHFAPCLDPTADCLKLGPNESVVVPLSEILGYAPETREAVVHWWTRAARDR
jgi:hypothetical protein